VGRTGGAASAAVACGKSFAREAYRVAHRAAEEAAEEAVVARGRAHALPGSPSAGGSPSRLGIAFTASSMIFDMRA
jgi:hypothetical protein